MANVTNEELAQMINKGFEHVTKEIGGLKSDVSGLKEDMDVVKNEIGHMSARFSRMESDVADIKRDIINRNEFEDLMGRVKYLELKLGIESGK